MKLDRFDKISQIPDYILERDVFGLVKKKNKCLLEELKVYNIVVADSDNFESMSLFKPSNSTTSATLVYKACQKAKNKTILDQAILFAKSKSDNKNHQVNITFDKLIVAFGLELLSGFNEKLFVEIDARQINNAEIITWKVYELLSQFEEAGINSDRIIFKIAATMEGIIAAERLTKEDIKCSLTLILSLEQAVACASVNVQLISIPVGLLCNAHVEKEEDQFLTSPCEPGILLVRDIYNYFKKFGYKTEIMAVDFNNIEEIIELSGCDIMAIRPDFLSVLTQKKGIVERKLRANSAKGLTIKRIINDAEDSSEFIGKDLTVKTKFELSIYNSRKDALKLETLIMNAL